MNRVKFKQRYYQIENYLGLYLHIYIQYITSYYYYLHILTISVKSYNIMSRIGLIVGRIHNIIGILYFNLHEYNVFFHYINYTLLFPAIFATISPLLILT